MKRLYLELRTLYWILRQIIGGELVHKYTCQHCNRTGDVLHYYAKVGGSDELVEQTVCNDIDACLKRKEET